MLSDLIVIPPSSLAAYVHYLESITPAWALTFLPDHCKIASIIYATRDLSEVGNNLLKNQFTES